MKFDVGMLAVQGETHALRVPAVVAGAIDSMEWLMDVADQVDHEEKRLAPLSVVCRRTQRLSKGGDFSRHAVALRTKGLKCCGFSWDGDVDVMPGSVGGRDVARECLAHVVGGTALASGSATKLIGTGADVQHRILAIHEQRPDLFADPGRQALFS